jgi:hypothetical protein
MSDVMSQLGTFLSSSGGKAVEGGAVAGTGLVQNFMANNEAQKKQKFVEQLISNPQKFNQYVAGFQQPLTAGLTQDVARQTDAYGAERGLGSSPVAMKSAYAQALAPILAQQQNEASTRALQALGVYEGSPTTKPVDISSILKALMMGKSPTPGAGAGGGPMVDPGLNVMQPGYMPGGGPDPSPPLPPSLVSGGAGFDPTTMEGG